MFYTNILNLLQIVAGCAVVVGGAFTLLAVASVHPDKRRDEVIPIGVIGGALELLLGFSMVFLFQLHSGSLLALIIIVGLTVAAVCQAVLRVYFLGTLRTLFTKVRADGR